MKKSITPKIYTKFSSLNNDLTLKKPNIKKNTPKWGGAWRKKREGSYGPSAHPVVVPNGVKNPLFTTSDPTPAVSVAPTPAVSVSPAEEDEAQTREMNLKVAIDSASLHIKTFVDALNLFNRSPLNTDWGESDVNRSPALKEMIKQWSAVRLDAESEFDKYKEDHIKYITEQQYFLNLAQFIQSILTGLIGKSNLSNEMIKFAIDAYNKEQHILTIILSFVAAIADDIIKFSDNFDSSTELSKALTQAKQTAMKYNRPFLVDALDAAINKFKYKNNGDDAFMAFNEIISKVLDAEHYFKLQIESVNEENPLSFALKRVKDPGNVQELYGSLLNVSRIIQDTPFDSGPTKVNAMRYAKAYYDAATYIKQRPRINMSAAFYQAFFIVSNSEGSQYSEIEPSWKSMIKNSSIVHTNTDTELEKRWGDGDEDEEEDEEEEEEEEEEEAANVSPPPPVSRSSYIALQINYCDNQLKENQDKINEIIDYLEKLETS